MKILSKLTVKNLKLNKTRTIVTIVGIMLSCALITGLAGLITSFLETSVQAAINDYGHRHVTFYDVPKDELKYIMNHNDVESFYLTENLGYSILENSNNYYKPYLNLVGMNSDSLNSVVKLIDGRLPLNSNEIVISEHISYDALVDYKIGDVITLNLGNRYLDDEIINQKDLYTDLEVFVGDKSNSYTVVGIMERSYIEDYSAPGYTIVTKSDDVVRGADISVYYKNSNDFMEVTMQINEMKNDSDDGKYETSYNSTLLDYQGSGLSSSTMKSIYFVGGIIAFIIIVTSVFCIRNSFAISITEKIKQYGMLASMGATTKQIRKNVLFEGLILGIIGITLGIIFGVLACYILIIIVNSLLAMNLNTEMIFSVSYEAIVISVLLSLVTIYLSCISSAYKASKITEIEAIRSSSEIKYKKIKAPKFIKKIFGVSALISYKNMKRNKKKFRITIISLTVSIATFISLFSFLDIGFGTIGDYYKDLDYNIIVSETGLTDVDSKLYEGILNSAHIESYSYINEKAFEVSEKYFTVETSDGMESRITMINSVGEEEYLRYISLLGYSYDEIKDKGILINTDAFDNTGKLLEGIKNIKDDVYYVDGFVKEEHYQLELVKTEKVPMGMEDRYNSNSQIIVSDELFSKMNSSIEIGNGDMYINSSNVTETVKMINTYGTDNEIDLYVVNIDDVVKEMNSVILVVSIFLYGFITVITLIGLTSIFNTITTNMNLRKNEFAMLKSIGMSKKEFNKMILFESSLYGLKSLLYGLPLGLLGGYLMFMATNVNSGTSAIATVYSFPLLAVMICIIGVFIIVFVIMKFSMSRINKQNIIETIRNENV